mmetsp:Transcript_9890/g.20027  ORF Transcript_9890/g.20027 Transcript_9890/m.20027 type:complete len:362 (+) Transcript_9890:2-1087(+)
MGSLYSYPESDVVDESGNILALGAQPRSFLVTVDLDSGEYDETLSAECVRTGGDLEEVEGICHIHNLQVVSGKGSTEMPTLYQTETRFPTWEDQSELQSYHPTRSELPTPFTEHPTFFFTVSPTSSDAPTRSKVPTYPPTNSEHPTKFELLTYHPSSSEPPTKTYFPTRFDSGLQESNPTNFPTSDSTETTKMPTAIKLPTQLPTVTQTTLPTYVPTYVPTAVPRRATPAPVYTMHHLSRPPTKPGVVKLHNASHTKVKATGFSDSPVDETVYEGTFGAATAQTSERGGATALWLLVLLVAAAGIAVVAKRWKSKREISRHQQLVDLYAPGGQNVAAYNLTSDLEVTEELSFDEAKQFVIT